MPITGHSRQSLFRRLDSQAFHTCLHCVLYKSKGPGEDKIRCTLYFPRLFSFVNNTASQRHHIDSTYWAAKCHLHFPRQLSDRMHRAEISVAPAAKIHWMQRLQESRSAHVWQNLSYQGESRNSEDLWLDRFYPRFVACQKSVPKIHSYLGNTWELFTSEISGPGAYL